MSGETKDKTPSVCKPGNRTPKKVLLDKKAVLADLRKFLDTLIDTSTLTVNVKVAKIEKLSGGVRAETIHGLRNNGSPCGCIESQGSAQFFRPCSKATVADIDAEVKNWAQNKGWRTRTVAAVHNLEASPFYADEETLNFVVFFALSPRPITVNSMTGCALPGSYGSQYTVHGEWENIRDKPPQTTVYSRIPKPALSGTIMQRIHGKLNHAIQMLNNVDKPFLQYT
jgi:hypothetical protein